MAMMKLDTHISSPTNPFIGAQSALANVGALMENASNIHMKNALLAEQQKKDMLANKQQTFRNNLLQQQINDKQTQQAFVNNIATQTANRQSSIFKQNQNNQKALAAAVSQDGSLTNGNAYHLGALTDTIGAKYDAANKIAAAKVKALGLSVANGDGKRIGQIYDQATYGTSDPQKVAAKQAGLQNIFDNNVMSKGYYTNRLLQDYAKAGGTNIDKATLLANTLATSNGLLTPAQKQAQEVASAAAINKAKQAMIKNNINLFKVASNNVKAKNKALHDSYTKVFCLRRWRTWQR